MPENDDLTGNRPGIDATIARLTLLLAQAGERPDPELAGLLGDACLDRYVHAESPDPADLRDALDWLHTACAAAPNHQDSAVWQVDLGLAYSARADDQNQPADWDTAITWFGTALNNHLPADIDPGELTAELVWCHLRRFFALRTGWPDTTAGKEADRLVTMVDALVFGARAGSGDRTVRHRLTMLRGLAVGVRYQELGAEADRALGITLLAKVLPGLPDGTPNLDVAWDELGDLYLDQYAGDDSNDALRNWVSARQRAVALTEPDHPLWTSRSLTALAALTHQWDTLGDPTDRDTAITGYAAHLARDAAGPDAWFDYGLLRCERAASDASTGPDTRPGRVLDLTEAINWLRRAAEANAENGDVASPWIALAEAYRLRWKLTGDTGDRDQVVPCIDHAEAADAAMVAVDLPTLGSRLEALGEQLSGRLDTELAPLRERTRRLLDAAYAATEGPAVDRAEAATLAQIGARVELHAFALLPEYADEWRARRWLPVARAHPEPPPGWLELLLLLTSVGTILRQLLTRAGRIDGVDELLAALRGALAVASPEFRDTSRSAAGLVGTAALLTGVQRGDNTLLAAGVDVFRELARHDGAGTTVAHVTRDEAAVRTIIGELTVLHDRCAPDSTAARDIVDLLGRATVTLAGWRPGDSAAIDAAVRWNTPLADPPDTGGVAGQEQLAHALRLRGRPEDLCRSRELALDRLGGDAARVPLGSVPEPAMATVRAAADLAVTYTGWCLADAATDPAAPADLVRILEASRGRVLHATVGKPLAEPAQPLSAAEIGPVLRRARLDLLAYLVPASPAGPGAAVLVAGNGSVRLVPLPDLGTGPDTPIATYARAYRAWRAARADAGVDRAGLRAAFDTWAECLDALGGWAWRVAGESLLAAATRLVGSAGRVPRLVLVPLGPLGLVPWHSAWRTDPDAPSGPGDRRYLVRDAMVSVIPSAGLLAEVTARPPATAGDVLVIGDPGFDLPWAWSEADAICQTLYPNATCLGSGGQADSADGPGRVDELLAWLAGARVEPKWLLHLACPANTDSSEPGRSVVDLADRQLSTAELLTSAPAARMNLETVVLSGCQTDVSDDNYDEAFSIATTFLAMGARTALDSLWHIQDFATAVFMFMFHHHLNTRHPGQPARALHATRLWMLDRDREIPHTMPAHLAGRARRTRLDRSIYWAAYNHLGA